MSLTKLIVACELPNGRGFKSNRSCLCSGQIQWEIVSVTLMHYFHTQTSAVENVCPGVQNTTLTINNGLIEVEAVEVERHSGDAEGGKPDPQHRPGSEEEVKAAAIIEGSILENKATKVAVCRYDVVRFFFLAKLVAIVLRDVFSRLSDETRSNQASVHSTKQSPTEYAGNAQHMKRMHEDIVLRLEDQHKVESSRDTEGHPIRKATLSKGVYQENSRCSSHWS